MKRIKNVCSLLLLLSCCSHNFILAQITPQQDLMDYYEDEYMDDPYISVPEIFRTKTPAYTFSNSDIFTIQVNTDSMGNNIVGDAANEPSIGIDPNNNSRMAIGWRQFESIQSSFRQAGLSISNTGGENWLPIGPLEAENFLSDPVLDTDTEGKFYYNSLSNDLSCQVFHSNDLVDWSDKTEAYGGDKQWMVIDKSDSNTNGQIYAFWKDGLSTCEGNFTRSTDGGASYNECTTVPGNPTRGTLSIGPDGEVYACGGVNGTFRVLKSTNVTEPEVVNPFWVVNNAVNLKGAQALYAGPNPSGMLGQVWIATDHSDLPSRGNAYLLSAVTRNDNGDPADIMFSRSTNGGNNWSEAIRINDDQSTENWQWFGSLSVAPNGRIDVTWLDTRDHPNTFLSSLYYSYSFDEGETWSENQRLSDEFDPHLGWPNQQKMGDYFHSISENEGVHLAWAATFNGEQDVYYSYITAPEPPVSVSYIEDDAFDILSIKAFPNPVINHSDIYFYTKNSSRLQIEILDLMGNTVQHLQNRIYPAGNHSFSWNAQNNLSTGIYILKIEDQFGNISTSRMMVL